MNALLSMKSDANRQAKAMFDSYYNYYTKQELLDSKTTCGFIVSSAISVRKMSGELLQRKAIR